MLAAPGEAYELLPGAKQPVQAATISPAEETAGPDAGKGRKPRKSPTGERKRPSGEEGDHAPHP